MIDRPGSRVQLNHQKMSFLHCLVPEVSVVEWMNPYKRSLME
jgi:hypothetical protein